METVGQLGALETDSTGVDTETGSPSEGFHGLPAQPEPDSPSVVVSGFTMATSESFTIPPTLRTAACISTPSTIGMSVPARDF